MGNKPEGMKEAGIKLVASTVPYENLKIRLNYGTRLSVAIVSKALGYTTFEAALKDASVLKFAKRYMNEVSNGLGQLPPDIDLDSYKKHMIERMGTEELNYVTHRVVESASKKARVDWQPVLESQPSGAASSLMMSHAIATWAHLLAHSELCKSDGFPVIDVNITLLQPLAKEMIASVRTPNAESAAAKFVTAVFGPDAKFNQYLCRNIVSSLVSMEKLGINGELSRLVN
jgi:mannitol-1-phosphate/altronate dehydrogenase